MRIFTVIGAAIVAACIVAMQTAAPVQHCQREYGHGPGQHPHYAVICQ